MVQTICPIRTFRNLSAGISLRIHTIQRKARRDKRHCRQLKTQSVIKDDGWPAGIGFLNRAILAGFTNLSKPGSFCLYGDLHHDFPIKGDRPFCSTGCRSPPHNLFFDFSKTDWRKCHEKLP